MTKNPNFDLQAFLEEHGVGYREVSGGNEIILDQCPNCGKSNKFYISVDTCQFICFKCSGNDTKMKGGPINLVMLLGHLSFREAKRLVEGNEVDIPVKDDGISALLDVPFTSFEFHRDQNSKTKTVMPPPNPLRLPRYILPINREAFPEAYGYLESRGLSEEMIQQSNIYASGINSPQEAAEVVGKHLDQYQRKQMVSLIYYVFKNKVPITDVEIEKLLIERRLPAELTKRLTDAIWASKMRGRVIFPIKVQGYTFGWVARDFTKQSQLKVLNSSGPFKYYCVWNFDQVKDSETIVVCEGIISAIKCGAHRSVATLGKFVSDDQINLLRKTKANRIIICLDVDAQATAIELKRRLLPFFGEVFNLQLPAIKVGKDYKDAGDYSVEEMDEFIKKAPELDTEGLLIGNMIIDD
jgi:hypothetical protein